MSRRIYDYGVPDRFVAGTVGEPGNRTFFLQARSGARLVSVALEKQQVAALVQAIVAKPRVAIGLGKQLFYRQIEKGIAAARAGKHVLVEKPMAATADQKRRARQIARRLAKHYPDAACALNFRSPLELLVATILSAQCTDKRVNMVTPADGPSLGIAPSGT